jgi:hypothetical protein
MTIHEASKDIRYLLNRGYKKSYALKFVCDHYQLTQENRYFLARTTFSDEEATAIQAKKMPIDTIHRKDLAVDGYNVLITVEALLKGEAVICDDFVVRDTQGVFGNYTITDRTHTALTRISEIIGKYHPKTVTFYFDEQVSHSGDLCSIVRNIHSYSCETHKHVDQVLAARNTITATSDSVLIHKLQHFVDIPFEIFMSKTL